MNRQKLVSISTIAISAGIMCLSFQNCSKKSFSEEAKVETGAITSVSEVPPVAHPTTPDISLPPAAPAPAPAPAPSANPAVVDLITKCTRDPNLTIAEGASFHDRNFNSVVLWNNKLNVIGDNHGDLTLIGTGNEPSIKTIHDHGSGTLIVCNMTVDIIADSPKVILVNSKVKRISDCADVTAYNSQIAKPTDSHVVTKINIIVD